MERQRDCFNLLKTSLKNQFKKSLCSQDATIQIMVKKQGLTFTACSLENLPQLWGELEC